MLCSIYLHSQQLMQILINDELIRYIVYRLPAAISPHKQLLSESFFENKPPQELIRLDELFISLHSTLVEI